MSVSHVKDVRSSTEARGNRQIHYNPVYEELKAKQHQKLKSEEG
jgi:transposase